MLFLLSSRDYTAGTAHNPKVVGSNPAPATSLLKGVTASAVTSLLLLSGSSA
jgi:hypothetical protein